MARACPPKAESRTSGRRAVCTAQGTVTGGEHLVLINRDPTDLDDRAGLVIRAPIGEVLAAVIASADD